MPSDRILTVLHNPGCGEPAYFSISRDVGGGTSIDAGQIPLGRSTGLRAGQVLRCGSCGEAITRIEAPRDLPPRSVALNYRPYLEEAPE